MPHVRSSKTVLDVDSGFKVSTGFDNPCECNFDSGLQISGGELRVPKPRTTDFSSQNFPYSGIRMGRLTIRKDAKGKAVRSLPIFYREVFRLLIVLDTLILYSRR